MKWVNHRISTFALVFIITRSFVASLISAYCSVIPDAIEGNDYSSQSWKKNHRKISHWLLGYILVALLLWGIIFVSFKVNVLSVNLFASLSLRHVMGSYPLFFWIEYAAFFAVIGAVLHVLEDALSAPVPLFNPTKRNFCIRLMRTGSTAEYIFSVLLFLLSVYCMVVVVSSSQL